MEGLIMAARVGLARNESMHAFWESTRGAKGTDLEFWGSPTLSCGGLWTRDWPWKPRDWEDGDAGVVRRL